MRLNINSTGGLLISCVVLPLLYFLAYGFFGFCDTDQGFIQALSWRIIQGEVPYLDFIYVRPPLSLYFHTLLFFILPDSWVVLGERFLFYFLMSLSVFWSIRSLQAFYEFEGMGFSPFILAVLAYVCSVHNFPPMAWHTVDGIFFASLGIHLLSRGKSPLIHAFGLISIVLAGMTKQAFYPLIVAGPVFLGIIQGRKALLRGGGIAGIFLFITLAPLIFLAGDWLEAFWSQTGNAGNWNDLWEAGVIRYIKPFFLITLPLIIGWRTQVVYDWKYLPISIFGLAFFGLLGLHVYKALEADAYIGPSFGFSQAFFLLAVGIALKGFWINHKASSLLLMMLLVSWCTGISWGYANNMLYFTPILFGFIYGMYEELNFIMPRYFYGVICLLLIWVFAILYQYPYRDGPKDQLDYSAGDIFPRLSGIYTGEPFYSKALELRTLHQRFEGTFTVLPAYPLAHYLTGLPNPVSIDWAHNAEADIPDQQDLLQADLNRKADYVFVEKDKLKEARDDGPYGSSITGYIIDHWTLIYEGTWFQVYEKTKPSPG